MGRGKPAGALLGAAILTGLVLGIGLGFSALDPETAELRGGRDPATGLAPDELARLRHGHGAAVGHGSRAASRAAGQAGGETATDGAGRRGPVETGTSSAAGGIKTTRGRAARGGAGSRRARAGGVAGRSSGARQAKAPAPDIVRLREQLRGRTTDRRRVGSDAADERDERDDEDELAALGLDIVDSGGRSVEGARVELAVADTVVTGPMATMVTSAALPREARSDAAGRVAIAGLPTPLRYRLKVESGRHAPFLRAGLRLLPGRNDLRIRLTDGAGISGRVVDQAGSPIAGAELIAEQAIERAGLFRSEASSGADGRFRIAVRESSVNTITAKRHGYTTTRELSVAAGRDDLTLTLERLPGLIVSGTARAAGSGAPIPQLIIDGEPVLTAAGEFEIELPLATGGGPRRFTLEAPGAIPIQRTLQGEAGTRLELGELLFRAGLSYTGRIEREPEGGGAPVPVEGARITIGGSELRSDAIGRFTIENLAAGAELTFTVDGGPGLQRREVTRTAPAEPDGEPALGFHPDLPETLLLSRGRYELAVEVRDAADQPIAGVAVDFEGHQGTTDASGQALLTGMTVERGTLVATHPEFHRVERGAVEAGLEAFDFLRLTMVRGTVVRGAVTRRGASLGAGVTVSLWPAISGSGQGPGPVRHVSTDSSGLYRFEDIEAGAWFLHVPGTRHVAERVDVAEGDLTRRDLDVQGRVDLTGRILKHDGSPHPNVTIYLHDGDQDDWVGAHALTDASGAFQFPMLRPGMTVLSVLKSQVDPSAQHVFEFVLPDEPAVQRTFQLPVLTGSIAVTVTGSDGAPVTGLHVGCERLDAPHREIISGWGQTDAEGKFRFDRLAAGTYRVRSAWADHPTAFSEVITLANGATQSVALTLETATRALRLSGRLVSSDGGPICGSFLYLIDGQGRQSGNWFGTAKWGSAANFLVRGLVPGQSYQLVVTGRDHLKRTVPITAGTADMTNLVIALDREP